MSFHQERDSDSEARWQAWLARGATHERAVRRRFMTAAPIVLVVGALVFAFLVR